MYEVFTASKRLKAILSDHAALPILVAVHGFMNASAICYALIITTQAWEYPWPSWTLFVGVI
jgi:hypothetical protein